MKSQLEEYFRKFIVDVQGLTMSSANHYAQALRTCSPRLSVLPRFLASVLLMVPVRRT